MKILVLLLLAGMWSTSTAQIPAKQRGYSLRGSRASTVVVELFYDLLCVDSKANWAVTRQLIDLSTFTEEQFGLQLDVFPLPYHHHAFFVAMGFRAYMAMAATKTRQEQVNCIESVFANQDNFLVTDAQMGESALEADIVKFFKDHCSVNLEPIFSNATVLRSYNMQAREDWKYAAARTVHGTPSFVINGFLSDDAGDYTLDQWIELIKNLLAGHDQELVGRS